MFKHDSLAYPQEAKTDTLTAGFITPENYDYFFTVRALKLMNKLQIVQ